jgi:uncharacterized protein YyaL (SSP411 family)
MYRAASKTDTEAPSWSNRLTRETSPYLRQHAHNPVDWYPWGEEAFKRARTEDRPIFLSIGYSSCHWCHVMERESFADPLIAAYLNTHFIPIKVDREERPEVDAIYIHALLQISGSAGWPATLFLAPDLRPFTGATYLPPSPRYGMPSFRQVLERVRDSWSNHREAVIASGAQLQAQLLAPPLKGELPDFDLYRHAVVACVGLHDDELGGFGYDQKFPQTPILELLLLGAHDGDDHARAALALTLNAMDDGGLQDHLGGGFHRYCVDRDWSVPHFEKMLYDNAQLVRVYTRASAMAAADGDRDAARAYIRVVEDTIAYLLRDMLAPDGTFYAAEDADDPEGEGRFYTFTPEEAREVVPAGALPFGVREGGNFEDGRTVLTARDGRPTAAVRDALRRVRDRRARPARDDKRVVAWNGLAIGALAEAGRLYARPAWVEAAKRAAETLIATMDAEGRLPRVLGSSVEGTLEDSAFVADGLLDLYQADPGERRWLDAATRLARSAIALFGDGAGGFFQARSRDDLIVRRKDWQDNAEPSGNGRMADVLRRLVAYGAPGVEAAVLDRLLAASAGFLRDNAVAAPELWSAVRAATVPASRAPWTLVIAGAPDDPAVKAMLRVWNRTWRPQGVVAVTPGAPTSAGEAPYAVFEDRGMIGGLPTAYLCRGGVCALPVHDADGLLHQLG